MSRKTRELLDQMLRDRAILLSTVDGVSAELMDQRPSPDAWSISDILHHLALTEEAASKLLSRMLSKARELGLPSDPDPEGSVLDSITAIVAPADHGKGKAPDRVNPRSHVAGADALARMKVARAAVTANVTALSDYDVSSLTFPHPVFGELDAYQWVLVTCWHERRHAKQIERVRDDLKGPG